jgi:hypothetical protein
MCLLTMCVYYAHPRRQVDRLLSPDLSLEARLAEGRKLSFCTVI